MEEERREEKRLKREQDDLILQWETCDRLVQGLNDFIKDAVMNPKGDSEVDEDLSGAQVIWSKRNNY